MLGEHVSVTKILLVDNAIPELPSLKDMLKDNEFIIYEANSFHDAINLARGSLPDLIILATTFPKISIKDICQQLKWEINKLGPSTSSALILFIDSNNSISEASLYEEGFIDGYLAQPVDKSALVTTIRSLLRMGRAEQAAKESEQRLSVALEAGRVIAWEWDAHTDNVEWSGSWERLTLEDGISIKAKNFLTHIYPKDREHITAIMNSLSPHSPRYHAQYRVLNNDKQVYWIDERAEGKFYADGMLAKLSGISVDITDRKISEEALRQSEEWCRLASSGAGIGYWYFDVPSETVMVDDACMRMLGLHTTIMPTKSELLKNIDSKDRFSLKKQLLKTFFGERFVSEFRLQPLENRHPRWIAAYGNLVKAEQDRPYRITGVILDITPIKLAQRALKEANDLNTTITANATTSICILDKQGLCTLMNPAFEAMAGYSFSELEGRPLYQLLQQNSEVNVAAGINNLFPDEDCLKTTCTREDFFVRRNGTTFPVICTSSPILKDHEVAGVVLEVRDITKEKEAAQTLLEANKRKDEFLAMLAHELRNPLAPIRNALQILRIAGNDQTIVEKTRALMDRQLQQMVRLIDDLLDVARISRGTIELRKEYIELRTIVGNAVEALEPLMKASSHRFTYHLPETPIYLHADPTRLTQVLTNILNNAAKYTNAEGEICLSATSAKDEVLISVKDNGIGIPPNMLPKIFDLFTQVDGSLERSHGGLGIGLTLVRKITEMHDGTITAQSNGLKSGSEFILRFPTVPITTALKHVQKNKNHDASIAQNFRILIADDNKDAADSLATMLSIMGNVANTAYDGMQAIEMISLFRPDIVLLDIGMPKLNGYETAYLLREQFSRQEIVLIALSGWGQEEDKRRSKQAGFDYHLVKPVSAEELSDTLYLIRQRNFDTV